MSGLFTIGSRFMVERLFTDGGEKKKKKKPYNGKTSSTMHGYIFLGYARNPIHRTTEMTGFTHMPLIFKIPRYYMGMYTSILRRTIAKRFFFLLFWIELTRFEIKYTYCTRTFYFRDFKQSSYFLFDILLKVYSDEN